MLGGTQGWYGHCGEEKNLLLLLGIEPRFLGCPACSLYSILTGISSSLGALTKEKLVEILNDSNSDINFIPKSSPSELSTKDNEEYHLLGYDAM
jgi:hypothetical protein